MQLQDKFCAALDAQELVRADGIIVLRNVDPAVTKGRMEYALELLANGYGSFVMMPFADNTKAEAEQIKRLLGKKTNSLILVTNRDHHYRAFLTFLNVMPTVRLASAPIGLSTNSLEFQKIKNYQKLGDVASYEEGLERLR